jgi:putative redox protein
MAALNLTLTLEEQPFVLSLENEDGLVTTIDASPAIGGKQRGLRPMELLAGALAGCMSIDVLSILKKQRLDVQSYSVKVAAKRSEAIPGKFEAIELQFFVDESIPLDKVEHAVKLSHEKYCSVSASMHPEITVTTIVKHHL